MASAVGKWAFIIGALLAVLMGILEGVGQALGTNLWLVLLLLVLGLIIGFVNIAAKEVQPFLVASIAVLVTAGAAALVNANTLFSPLGDILVAVVRDVVLVVAPAALVVGLRAVYGFAAE
ncbi:MAG: hypothetical protein V3V78_02200 [Candidatus Woesearchaeota archaeon]